MKKLSAILCLLLAACGGGSQGAPKAQAAAPATDVTVTVAMYGDSTAWGSTPDLPWTGLYHQSPDNEPASLQWLLRQKYGLAVTVENHGVPGSTCPELLNGTPPASKTFEQEMESTSAQLVTMNCAINDAFVTGESDTDFSYTYSQFAQIAQRHGKVLVIEGPNPVNRTQNARLWQLLYDEKVLSATWGIPMVDQYDLIIANLPWWQTLLPDNIHPNDSLYESKAVNSFAVLDPIVGALLNH
jgi:hypothetical protein